MQYYSHYIWESGSEERKNPVSVVLQQVSRNKHHYLLACVCDGRGSIREIQMDECTNGCNVGSNRENEQAGSLTSGYFTERLVEWFHGPFLQQVSRKSCSENEIYRSLSRELEKTEGELREFCMQKKRKTVYDVWGILLSDECFWIFQKGKIRGYLFNRRFNRLQRKLLQIAEGEERNLVQGNVQKRIGILLCTPEFGNSVSEEDMLQVLFEEPMDAGKIKKGLEEIWKADIAHGYAKATGAVYIRVE